jgi:hypothetical protein
LDDALLKKMAKEQPHSPLLGYNTNVRHSGELFHIQTEDSGVGHPHVITHLFVEGTILATKKTSYSHLLESEDLESEEAPKPPSTPTKDRLPAIEIDAEGVRIIRPSVVKEVMRRTPPKTEPKPRSAGRSIFDTPAEDGDFGESMITDKSLDEVILSYLADDLDE